LTNEDGWMEFERGQLLLFDKGLAYKTPSCCELVEREGRGLYSKCFQRRRCVSNTSPLSTTPPISTGILTSVASSQCRPDSPKSALQPPSCV
jgi:hypothetical protein